MPAGPIQEVTNTFSIVGSINPTVTAPSNGNTLILIIDLSHATTLSTVSAVSLTGTSGWARLAVSSQDVTGTTHRRIEIWGGDVGIGAGTSMSVTFSTGNCSGQYDITEWSGLNPIASIIAGADAGNGATTGTTASIAGFTTSQPSLVILAIAIGGGSITAHPAGYTSLTAISILQGEYQFNVAAGSVTASWTLSASNHWWCTGVGLESKSAGGLFRPPLLNAVTTGGPFFADPIS